MRCPYCATPAEKVREYGDGSPPETILYWACPNWQCLREGDNLGPAEEDGPSETGSFSPSDGGRAAMKAAGRPVR